MNIFTIDLEEWFHINDSTWIPVDEWPKLENKVIANTNLILTFFKQHNIKASFFVLGWIAEQYPELIKQIESEGHDIGYHSYYHRIPRFQSKKEFEQDLEAGVGLLEQIVQRKIEYYRAPNFSLKNKWMLDCLIEHGITVSSSIKNPIHHNGHSLPDKPFIFKRGNNQIIELPLTTTHLPFLKFAYSGSGYFRILPYPLMKYIYKNKPYLMMYFHPNDFDTQLPTPKALGIVRNTLNTVGTSTTLPKLERLTRHHQFVSISQALRKIDTNTLPVIEY